MPIPLNRPVEGDVKVSAKFLNELLKRIERLEKLHCVAPLTFLGGGAGMVLGLDKYIPGIGMFELLTEIGSPESSSSYVSRRSAEARIIYDNEEPPYDIIYGDQIFVYDPLDIFSGNIGDQGYFIEMPNGRRHIVQLHC